VPSDREPGPHLEQLAAKPFDLTLEPVNAVYRAIPAPTTSFDLESGAQVRATDGQDYRVGGSRAWSEGMRFATLRQWFVACHGEPPARFRSSD
jgi:hypothetical protein